MSIIRIRTQINGYAGMYSCETCAKPSYCVEIYKKTIWRTELIRKYYMIFHVFRTIGIREMAYGEPSVAKEYGDVVECEYKYMDNVQPKSLKRLYPSLVSF